VETSRYLYHLPKDLIAQHPVPRGTERLLVVDRARSSLQHLMFGDLPGLLRPSDVLALNDTKVIPARLVGRKDTGGEVEVFLLRESAPSRWRCLMRTSKRVSPGMEIRFGQGLSVRVEERLGAEYVVSLSDPDMARRIGKVPLPPYIDREPEEADRQSYQTVYARHEGSVAAPTAGMHFTPELLGEIQALGVKTAFVTLHVGLGTFAPIRTAHVEDHDMHGEDFEVLPEDAAVIDRALEDGRRVVAVGSTVTRVLEHLMAAFGHIEACRGSTDLFIREGFRFRATGALLTNFHLPCSTLLVLVCAFAGHDLAMRAYGEAVERRYRFFSYGDAMLII
jgi:S-adenosylmethionine:tRNA ribosyltransferase-isomerase